MAASNKPKSKKQPQRKKGNPKYSLENLEKNARQFDNSSLPEHLENAGSTTTAKSVIRARK